MKNTFLAFLAFVGVLPWAQAAEIDSARLVELLQRFEGREGRITVKVGQYGPSKESIGQKCRIAIDRNLPEGSPRRFQPDVLFYAQIWWNSNDEQIATIFHSRRKMDFHQKDARSNAFITHSAKIPSGDFSGCGEGLFHWNIGADWTEQKLILGQDVIGYTRTYFCPEKSGYLAGKHVERFVCRF